MLKKQWIVLIFTYGLAGNLHATPTFDQKYDIKDLEILEKQKNYSEFLLHVNDIRPSSRTKHWTNMFQNMALTLINEKIQGQDYSNKTFLQIEKLASLDWFKNDEVFQNRRTDYAVLYFKNCFKTNSDKKSCEKDLYSFWNTSNQDADAALAFTSYLNESNSTSNMWTFYNAIVNDQISPLYCKREEIQRAVIKKITQETFKENFNGSYKDIISKFISDKCIKEIYPTLKEAIVSNKTNGLDKEVALNILWQMKELSLDEKEFYLTVYFISGPVVGEKLNLAWTLISKLSENFSKRQELLKKLTQLEILPDGIFADPKLPRNKALIEHLAQNFPEILNFYGSECVNFLKNIDGTHVTSGFRCNQFLEASKDFKTNGNSTWISDKISTEYSALKK